MAYTKQLSYARASGQLKRIAGTCGSSDEFRDMVNEAMRRLDRRGSFFDSEHLMRFCVYNGCITWPRIVGTVLGARPCSCGSMDVRNNWYDVIGPISCSSFRSTFTMTDAGTGCAYNKITGDEEGKYVRAYILKATDVGKTITLFGKDYNGQPLQEQVGGVWQRGMTLTLANPYVQTPVKIRSFDKVVRQATEGNIMLFEFDDETDLMRDLALYEPTETHPRYRQSVIHNFCNLPSACAETDGVRYRTIEVMVKLNFIEVVNEEDFLAIDNIDALKFGLQAIRYEEEGDNDKAEEFILKAIRELNFESRNKNPSQQSTIRVNPVGRSILSPM